jgi:hypothetical protein
MALKYELSAAGLSVNSLLQQITNATTIEQLQYKMLGENSALTIEMAQNSQIYTTKAGHDEADATRAGGIAQIVGGALTLAVTAGSLAVSAYRNYQADQQNKIDQGLNKSEAEVTAKPNLTVPGSPPETVTVKASTTATPAQEGPANGPTGETAVVKSQALQEQQIAADTNNTVTKAGVQQTADNKAAAETDIVKGLRSDAEFWRNNAQLFGGIPTTIAQGTGGTIQAGFQDQKALDSGLAALYQNMPSVFSNMYGMNKGVIDGEEGNKQSIISVWGSMVQASTSGVRG